MTGKRCRPGTKVDQFVVAGCAGNYYRGWCGGFISQGATLMEQVLIKKKTIRWYDIQCYSLHKQIIIYFCLYAKIETEMNELNPTCHLISWENKLLILHNLRTYIIHAAHSMSSLIINKHANEFTSLLVYKRKSGHYELKAISSNSPKQV